MGLYGLCICVTGGILHLHHQPIWVIDWRLIVRLILSFERLFRNFFFFFFCQEVGRHGPRHPHKSHGWRGRASFQQSRPLPVLSHRWACHLLVHVTQEAWTHPWIQEAWNNVSPLHSSFFIYLFHFIYFLKNILGALSSSVGGKKNNKKTFKRTSTAFLLMFHNCDDDLLRLFKMSFQKLFQWVQ